MLASLFTDGVSIYAFFAMQPYLLQLYGDPTASGVAGLAAAIVGGAQIGGGLLVPHLRRAIRRRTSVAADGDRREHRCSGADRRGASLLGRDHPVGPVGSRVATVMPVRQAYVNDLIPSEQRATVLSFDSLMGSSGGVVTQPVLGRVADVYGYPLSYSWSAAIQALGIPFMSLARRQSRYSPDA
jgi:MFS family permease